MLQDSAAFSGYSVNDLAAAQTFYTQTLGLTVAQTGVGLDITLGGDKHLFLYPKPDHQAASFTVLNFPVQDIDAAVDELTAHGVEFIQYHDPQMPQDDKGVLRGKSVNMGPDIAWFKDPAGNILSVLQN